MLYHSTGYRDMEDNIKVLIDTEGPGIYCLGFNGGQGKTWLYTILQAKSVLNEDILCITYDKHLTESDVLKEIREFNGRLLMLDRLNLYYTKEIGEALTEINCIILIDLKDNRKLREMPIRLARIKYTEDCIEVREV